MLRIDAAGLPIRWARIPRLEHHSASSLGNIRNDKTGRVLAQRAWGAQKYLIVGVCELGVRKTYSVHRLCALAFLGNPPTAQHQVAHYDGDPENNRIENIRWVLPEGNAQDRKRHGTSPTGSSNVFAKLHEKDIPRIKEQRRAGVPTNTIATTYGVHPDTIRLIVSGKTWGHVCCE